MTETEIARELVALMDRELILSADADMCVVRISGKGETVVHVGVSPERAMRLGAAFVRAALHVDPSLRLQLVDETGAPVASPVVPL